MVHVLTTMEPLNLTDINEDGVLCQNDLNAVMDALTGGKLCEKSKQKMIEHVREYYKCKSPTCTQIYCIFTCTCAFLPVHVQVYTLQ